MSDLLVQLRGCATRIRDLRAELKAELRRRDQLVSPALDEGHGYAAVSAAAGLCSSRVATIHGDTGLLVS